MGLETTAVRKLRRPVDPPEKVRAVEVATRELVVLGPDKFEVYGDYGEAERAIVWFEPPASASQEAVVAYRQRLLGAGALRVVVLPAAKPDEDVPTEPLARLGVAGETARAAALALVEEVEEEIRPEVRELVEGALARAGL